MSKNEMFYRIDENGNAVILYRESGECVTRIDANVYPVDSDLSARYEHPRGIVLTVSDAVKIGIQAETYIKSGISETKKSYIVNVDDYINRERYYTGTRAGVVLRIEKSEWPEIMKPYNDYFETELDMILARVLARVKDAGEEGVKGVHVYRKGWIVR